MWNDSVKDRQPLLTVKWEVAESGDLKWPWNV